MTLDSIKFAAIVAAAKTAAANSPAWLRAIDRAAAGIQSGEMVVTTLAHGALVTSAKGPYLANGSCQCKAFNRGHKECYHIAAAWLRERYEAAMLETAPGGQRRNRKSRAIWGSFWSVKQGGRVSVSTFVGLYLRVLHFPADVLSALDRGLSSSEESLFGGLIYIWRDQRKGLFALKFADAGLQILDLLLHP
ncbi:MAG: hypothetical protein J2P21_32105 [Chloracidobacterium sp.]|nr:hypothetical protein [Chloracidobacterium sp.]